MTADRRRLFFALWPDAAARRHIVSSCAGVVAAAAGRPVLPENLHLTLAFLGSVPVADVDAIISAAGAVRFEPFELRLERTGCWSRTRVVWLAPRECPPALQQLVDALWAALASFGLHRDRHEFRPHVSLVRKGVPVVDGSLDEPVRWPVAEFVLAESQTLTQGAVYTPLARFPAARGVL